MGWGNALYLLIPFLTPPPQVLRDKTETWSSSEMSENLQLNPNRVFLLQPGLPTPNNRTGSEGSNAGYLQGKGVSHTPYLKENEPCRD